MQRTSGRLVAAGRCRADATRVVVHRTSQLLPRKHSRCCTAKAAASSARKSPAWDAPEVLVVGAGIAGLAAALALTKVGIPVRVLEASPRGLRDSEGSAIGFWPNAWRSLDALGVADELRGQFLRCSRVELCKDTGRVLRAFTFQETDAGREAGPNTVGSEFRGVLRSEVLRVLAAALPPGIIQPSAQVVEVVSPGGDSQGKGGAAQQQWPVLRLSSGEMIQGSVVVGADGARSSVAGEKGLGLPPPNYAGYVAHRGVAELPGGLESIGLPPDTIRQVWGAGVRAGLYPVGNDRRSCYWFTTFNAAEDAAVPSGAEERLQEALGLVRGWSFGVETAIKSTPPESISRSRIFDRWTLGSFGKGLVTLAGDAAHPMTPNLGQGGCTALEDAVVLARTLSQTASQTSSSAKQLSDALVPALREYESGRSRRCFPITARSYAMGAAMQIPFPPVTLARDLVVSSRVADGLLIGHFLDHTRYDAGTLLQPAS